MTFVPPAWTVGDGRNFRVTASAVAGRHSHFACPAKVALNARKQVSSLQPNDQLRWRRTWDDASRLFLDFPKIYDAFLNGATAMKAVEQAPTFTPPQRRFMIHALDQLQDLPDIASEQAGVLLEPGPDLAFEVDRKTMKASQVVLFSSDGLVREAVRLRLRDLKGDTDPGHEDYVAVVCWVLARADDPNRVVTPERVRVSEFSLYDSNYQVRFDGSVSEAKERYLAAGSPIGLAMNDLTYRPGSACADCDFLNVCEAVPQARGALGIPGRAVATRSISPADLAAYDRCPTAFHVQRRAHLPAAPPEGANDWGDERRRRGLATHAWLRWAHERTPARTCTLDDLPNPVADGEAAAEAARAAGLDP